MSRLTNRFDEQFDVLVIGAGIAGASAACVAARSGLRVALIDRGDFGSATSANSLKVIHGGLRYLQHLDIKRMRESIQARSLLLQLAPALVKPRGFVLPLHGMGLKSRWIMSTALGLNDLISCDRNKRLPVDDHIPGGIIISREKMIEQFPFLSGAHHHGGALWHDAVAEDTERLTLAFALDAEHHHAVIANHTQAVHLNRTAGRVSGADMCDVLSGETGTIRAKHVIWAGGESIFALDPTLATAKESPRSWVRAVNLVLDVPWPSRWGLAAEGRLAHREEGSIVQRGHRNLFFVPWREGVMVGTWYTALAAISGGTSVSTGEIDTYVAEIQSILPEFQLHRDRVSMVHSGILPASPGGSVSPAKKSMRLSGPSGGMPEGFTWMQAVKYTTAPILAAQTIDTVAQSLGKKVRSDIWNQPLVGAEYPRREMDEDFIRFTVAHEHAITLADVLLRRTGWGSYSIPDSDIQKNTATIMAGLLNWSDRRMLDEIENVATHYRNLGLFA
jgi:glycerol-3-phosphate dehydrogenase